MIYPITPVPAPRQVRSDKWNPRPMVVRYRAFRDEVRLRGVRIHPQVKLVFHIPMPKSWSKRKKAAMFGSPHMQTPDLDNFTKAILDAYTSSDAHVWNIHAVKIWMIEGAVEVYDLAEEPETNMLPRILDLRIAEKQRQLGWPPYDPLRPLTEG